MSEPDTPSGVFCIIKCATKKSTTGARCIIAPNFIVPSAEVQGVRVASAIPY